MGWRTSFIVYQRFFGKVCEREEGSEGRGHQYQIYIALRLRAMRLPKFRPICSQPKDTLSELGNTSQSSRKFSPSKAQSLPISYKYKFSMLPDALLTDK